MSIKGEVLYDSILKFLQSEDSELKELATRGIFSAPEIYLAFQLGKILKQNDKQIFGAETEWIRESDFNKIGPTDFAFKTDEVIHAFELKIISDLPSYKRDINKLLKLPKDRFERYFIAIVDSWAKDEGNDPRIIKLEGEFPSLSRLKPKFDHFATSPLPSGDLNCVLAIWKLD